jgi:hypothetical protein
MKRALLVLAVVLIAAVAVSQPSPGMVAPVPYCAICLGTNGFACWANYGVTCTAPEGVPHCTADQAAAFCPGWTQATASNQ